MKTILVALGLVVAAGSSMAHPKESCPTTNVTVTGSTTEVNPTVIVKE
jgi:hypothetical protein